MPPFRKILDEIIDFCSCGDDGLDITEYMEAIEHHFSINLEIHVIESLKSLADLCDAIAAITLAATNEEKDQIWIAVRKITSEQMGVAEKELHKQIRFVEDLCC